MDFSKFLRSNQLTKEVTLELDDIIENKKWLSKKESKEFLEKSFTKD